jgi:hypothetical protein
MLRWDLSHLSIQRTTLTVDYKSFFSLIFFILGLEVDSKRGLASFSLLLWVRVSSELITRSAGWAR